MYWTLWHHETATVASQLHVSWTRYFNDESNQMPKSIAEMSCLLALSKIREVSASRMLDTDPVLRKNYLMQCCVLMVGIEMCVCGRFFDRWFISSCTQHRHAFFVHRQHVSDTFQQLLLEKSASLEKYFLWERMYLSIKNSFLISD